MVSPLSSSSSSSSCVMAGRGVSSASGARQAMDGGSPPVALPLWKDTPRDSPAAALPAPWPSASSSMPANRNDALFFGFFKPPFLRIDPVRGSAPEVSPAPDAAPAPGADAVLAPASAAGVLANRKEVTRLGLPDDVAPPILRMLFAFLRPPGRFAVAVLGEPPNANRVAATVGVSSATRAGDMGMNTSLSCLAAALGLPRSRRRAAGGCASWLLPSSACECTPPTVIGDGFKTAGDVACRLAGTGAAGTGGGAACGELTAAAPPSVTCGGVGGGGTAGGGGGAWWWWWWWWRP